MPYCIAKYCHVSDRDNPKSAHFFTLPSKRSRPQIRRQWLAKCGRPAEKVKDVQARVCSNHFHRDDFLNMIQHESGFASKLLLKPDAVPSIFAAPEASFHDIPAPIPSARQRRMTKKRKQQILTDALKAGSSTAQQTTASDADESSSTDDATEADELEQSIPIMPKPSKPVLTHCPCCRMFSQVSVSDVSTQTDMDVILTAFSKDHTYAKVAVVNTTTETSSGRFCLNKNRGKDGTNEVAQEAEQLEEVVVESAEDVTYYDIHDDDDDEDGDSCEEKEDITSKAPDYVPSSDSGSDTDTYEYVSEEDVVDTDVSVPANYAEQQKFIVFDSSLMTLFLKCQKTGCSAENKVVGKILSGSRLIVKTKCGAGCTYTWSSQPTLNKMGAGNLLISAAILFSGNTYTRFLDISDHLNMPILGKTQFYAIQKHYLFPVINETWLSMQSLLLQKLSAEENLVMCGDGRCDSPGHCAKYGTYSLMEAQSGSLVDFSVCNTADPNIKNSNAMEPAGLRNCLNKVKDANVDVRILSTDRHITVRKILRTEYPEIIHQFDVWHLVKSITKRLCALTKTKGTAVLSEWINSITNHFWWCAMSCNGEVDLLREKWESLIYHSAGIHSWKDKKLIHACEHAPMDGDNTKWLKVGSAAHDALTKIVKDKNLTRDLTHVTLFCHTGELEVYHSLLLKYVPKRQHFSYEGMVCRTQLAAIDHNHHVGRQQATNQKTGQPMFNIVYPKCNKYNKKWVAKCMKVPKDYSYREDLMKEVVAMREHNLKKSRAVLPAVKPNIAPIDRPRNKDEVIRKTKQYTRFAPKL